MRRARVVDGRLFTRRLSFEVKGVDVMEPSVAVARSLAIRTADWGRRGRVPGAGRADADTPIVRGATLVTSRRRAGAREPATPVALCPRGEPRLGRDGRRLQCAPRRPAAFSVGEVRVRVVGAARRSACTGGKGRRSPVSGVQNVSFTGLPRAGSAGRPPYSPLTKITGCGAIFVLQPVLFSKCVLRAHACVSLRITPRSQDRLFNPRSPTGREAPPPEAQPPRSRLVPAFPGACSKSKALLKKPGRETKLPQPSCTSGGRSPNVVPIFRAVSSGDNA